jgi:hypothetical protein
MCELMTAKELGCASSMLRRRTAQTRGKRIPLGRVAHKARTAQRKLLSGVQLASRSALMPRRELIEPKQSDKRHIRRDEKGHFTKEQEGAVEQDQHGAKSGNPAPLGIPRALRSLPLQTSAACAALGRQRETS